MGAVLIGGEGQIDDYLEQVTATEGWLSPKQARLLHEAAARVRSGCIVEVGSYRGRSTIALATGAAEDVPVFAIEPHEPFTGQLGGDFGPEDRAEFYRTMLRTGLYRNVRLVNLSSEVVTRGWKLPVDLLWIDGDHRYEAVRRDVDVWLPYLTSSASIVLDDSTNPELGPTRVVDELLEAGWEVAERAGKVTRLVRRSD